jgi:hypothetical protein
MRCRKRNPERFPELEYTADAGKQALFVSTYKKIILELGFGNATLKQQYDVAYQLLETAIEMGLFYKWNKYCGV